MRVVRAVDLLVVEYEQLKEEQRLRIGTRDNLLYATLGSLAVITAATLQTGQSLLLLMVSPVCLILGWTYFVNDNRITAIARYIETVIGTALTARSEPGIPVLAWERAHRRGPGRRSRKVWQAIVDLLTFVFSTLVALAIVVTSGPLPTVALAMVLVELGAGCLLGHQFLAFAVRAGRVSSRYWSFD